MSDVWDKLSLFIRPDANKNNEIFVYLIIYCKNQVNYFRANAIS